MIICNYHKAISSQATKGLSLVEGSETRRLSPNNNTVQECPTTLIKIIYMKYDDSCQICNKTFTSSRALSYHLNMSHNKMTRREYVILTEYNNVTPKCKTDPCTNDAVFKFSEFGNYCSHKCRANSIDHMNKSKDALRKCQKDLVIFKKEHNGLTEYEYKLANNDEFKLLNFKSQKIVNINKQNVYIKKPNNWYRVDFLNEENKLIIEIDGLEHNHIDDNIRDSNLINLGYSVLRFTNEYILNNIDSVVRTITLQLKI